MSDGGGERLYGDYSCGDEQHFSDDSLEGAESRPLVVTDSLDRVSLTLGGTSCDLFICITPFLFA